MVVQLLLHNASACKNMKTTTIESPANAFVTGRAAADARAVYVCYEYLCNKFSYLQNS